MSPKRTIVEGGGQRSVHAKDVLISPCLSGHFLTLTGVEQCLVASSRRDKMCTQDPNTHFPFGPIPPRENNKTHIHLPGYDEQRGYFPSTRTRLSAIRSTQQPGRFEAGQSNNLSQAVTSKGVKNVMPILGYRKTAKTQVTGTAQHLT